MNRSCFARVVLAVVCLQLTSTHGWCQAAHPEKWPCNDARVGEENFPAVIVRAAQPNAQYYCKSSSSNPAALPVMLPNGSSVNVVVIGINPLRESYTLSVQNKPVVELSIADITKVLGVTLPSATAVPAAGSGKAGNTPAALNEKSAAHNLSESLGPLAEVVCENKFQDAHQKVVDLRKAAFEFKSLLDGTVNDALAKVDKYNDLIRRAQMADGDEWAAIGNEAVHLEPIPVEEPVVQGQVLSQFAENPEEVLILAKLEGKSLSEVATGLAVEALRLTKDPSLQPGPLCKAGMQATLDADENFLASVFSDVKGAPSLESNWKDRLNGLAAVATALNTAEDSLVELLNRPGAFRIVYSVPREDRAQNTETFKLTRTLHPSSLVTIGVGSGGSTAAANAQKRTAAKAAGGSDPAPTTSSFTLQFGQGQRLFLSGGFSVTPLATHVYSTTAAPAASATWAAATKYTIIDTSNSRTRILPMGLVHARMFDRYPADDWKAMFVPNYLTLGVSAKTDTNKGTSPEYLFGTSFSSPGNTLFLTVGAYTGAVERLGGGLTVGSITTLAATNLPITQQYHWKVGFSLSYKIK